VAVLAESPPKPQVMNAPAHISPQMEETHPEQAYLDLLADILANGVQRGDRTGTGTLGVFGARCALTSARAFPC